MIPDAAADLSELELPSNIMLHFPLGKDKLQVIGSWMRPSSQLGLQEGMWRLLAVP